MAFTTDLPAAARRHLDAAEKLVTQRRADVAGYLYGIAAECAVKAMVQEVPALRQHDILFAHFPELRTLLRDALQGRMAKPLAIFINDDAFMNNWNIRMRYTDGRQVRSEWITTWTEHARRIVNTMGT